MSKLFCLKSHNEIVTSPESGIIHIGVTITWYCINRLHPVIAYDEAIPEWTGFMNSSNATDRQINYFNTAAVYLDQFFTEDEALLLKDYLKKCQASDIVLEEIELPLHKADIPYNSIPPEPAAGQGYGFVDLDTSDTCPLDFDIRGYFDQQYETTLERYQVSVAKSLKEFRVPVVENTPDGFINMATELKQQLINLQNSLINLKNALDMIAEGAFDTKEKNIDSDKK